MVFLHFKDKREYLNYYRINIIIKDYKDKELTLIVECRVDTFASQELDKEINDELGNFNSLIMDFTNLKYFSSSKLRVLIVT